MKKIVYSSLAVCWFFYCIGGIITNANKYGFVEWLIVLGVFLFPFIVAILIKKIKKKSLSQPTEAMSTTSEIKTDEYIQSGNVIYRVDNKPISDEEVPYLMQVGYENALRKRQESTNPKFHRSFKEYDLSYEFSSKYWDEVDKRTDKFETLYKTALQTKDLAKRIGLLEQAVVAFEKAKKYCYSKGKGGTIYFQDMWECMCDSQNPCYSYLDVIQEALNNALSERDVVIPNILDVISDNDGILQKEIYDRLPDISKSDIQRIIRTLESENKLIRTKKSGSYELRIQK